MATTYARGVGMLTLVLALCATSCAKDPVVTSNFSEKMGALQELRDKIESRVSTFKGDCARSALLPSTCSVASTSYTDRAAKVNAWITAVQSEITATNSLEGLSSYDADFIDATESAAGYVAWADLMHSLARAPQGPAGPPATVTGGGGANAAPSTEELAKIGIQVAGAVWEQYQAGQKATAEALVAQMDRVRFRQYREVE